MRKSASHFRSRQRSNPTDAEAVLWLELRNRQLGGYKFARQVTLGKFTADFVCRVHKLVIEVDGKGHDRKDDGPRTRWLNEQGYSVLRLTNEQVMLERFDALKTILRYLDDKDSNTLDANCSPALPPERVRT